MGATQSIPDYEYIAYIDEAGDQGLRKVKPIDPDGASEWFIVSGVVIRRANEDRSQAWVNDMIHAFGSRQLNAIHFRRLRYSEHKQLACNTIAKLPVRCFVACSNKKNMKGYVNPWAGQIPSQNWFYCWMTRVLLERITYFIASDSYTRFRTLKRVKIVYSKSGGLRYPQMAAYYEWIRDKNRNDNQFLKMGDLQYGTLHPLLLEVREPESESRLSLPDIVASAFYRGCDNLDTGKCNAAYAKLLTPRMARELDMSTGRVSGYGVKLLPTWGTASLASDQQDIFRHFGYPHQWWDETRWVPDPYVP